ncbi:MAG: methionine adenosyltransferase [Alphaproteobacteria bacterium]|nr:methionine adenosyltransferase [Alphaproteobacteria bacterium]
MDQLVISSLDASKDPVEVVERKGRGHPDTICDSVAEALSRALSHEYLRRCGMILHHNVDKALLCAGQAAPAFGGGRVLQPITIYLAGRATREIGSDVVPVHDIAIATCKQWLRENMHALDVERHVEIKPRIQPGSQDLRALFAIGMKGGVPLANDTSIGVGYAPSTPVERIVLAIEAGINGRDRLRGNPAWGEDVKIMAVRNGPRLRLTIGCAMIGSYLRDLDAYLVEKRALAALAQHIAAAHGFPDTEVSVNAADLPAEGQVYLTVTGTSAEAGDDGEVGRGNRANGLITPCQPMSLEAAAGKNPISHVGKIYNVVARDVADRLVSEVPAISRAQCLLVSRIGAPVTQPEIVAIRLAMHEGIPHNAVEGAVRAIAADRIASIPDLVEGFTAGRFGLF